MAQRTFTLTIFLILASLSRHLPRVAPFSFLERQEQAVDSLIDAESLLASGQSLSLMCSDMSSLELIPGVSDTIASELLERRQAILRASRGTTIEQSLQLAHGIGDKTAQRLARYLTLDESCEDMTRYAPLCPGPYMK